jgi:hypothetical protein
MRVVVVVGVRVGAAAPAMGSVVWIVHCIRAFGSRPREAAPKKLNGIFAGRCSVVDCAGKIKSG